MFNVGGGEVLVILVLALVVLGPDKLPEAARSIGKHIGDVRRISSGFRAEISNAMDLTSVTGPTPEVPAPPPVAVVHAPAPVAARTTAATTAATPATAPAATRAPTPLPDQDLELVSSAPTWADGPVDSFV